MGGNLPSVRKKSSIYLDQELDLALTHAAAKQRLTKAEYIRRALVHAVEGDTSPPFTGVGVFEGPRDLARDADEHLKAAGFGET